jgi:hypothetical protein
LALERQLIEGGRTVFLPIDQAQARNGQDVSWNAKLGAGAPAEAIPSGCEQPESLNRIEEVPTMQRMDPPGAKPNQQSSMSCWSCHVSNSSVPSAAMSSEANSCGEPGMGTGTGGWLAWTRLVLGTAVS